MITLWRMGSAFLSWPGVGGKTWRFLSQQASNLGAEIGLDQSQFLSADRQGIGKGDDDPGLGFTQSWGTAFPAGIVPAQAVPVHAMCSLRKLREFAAQTLVAELVQNQCPEARELVGRHGQFGEIEQALHPRIDEIEHSDRKRLAHQSGASGRPSWGRNSHQRSKARLVK